MTPIGEFSNQSGWKANQQMLNLLHDKDDLMLSGALWSVQNYVSSCCVEVLPVVRPVAVFYIRTC